MALSITERWIRDKLKIEHDNLEDVRTLTLPGTYHEKISNLGNSLRNFNRLKNLDLSRNALVSLEGIEHAKHLEKLNLYYNNIPTLTELNRLRYCPQLREIDLRLNAVSRNEPDYRLFLIHMLPALQRLDDRGVRDSERKSALVHFATDQATELTEHAPRPMPRSPKRKQNPRACYVKAMTQKSSALDDDDVAVLDLISRTAGDLNQPRLITGSVDTIPRMREYSPERVRMMEQVSGELDVHSTSQYTPPAPTRQSELPVQDQLTRNDQQSNQQQEQGNRVQFRDPLVINDPNLKFQDEIDAYTSYKVTANFTPRPNAGTHPDDTQQSPNHANPSKSRDYPVDQSQQFYSSPQKPRSPLKSPANSNGYQEALNAICSLVDKYWNGAKSLERNQKFQSLANNIMKEQLKSTSDPTEEDLSNLHRTLDKLRHENSQLKEQLANHDSAREQLANQNAVRMSAEYEEMRSLLEQSERERETLKAKLLQGLDDKVALQQEVQQSHTQRGSEQLGDSSLQDARMIDDLKRSNEQYRHRAETFQIRLKQYSQMEGLASMLQQSHKSLVQTNDQLLRELDETRQRHKHEVQQLRWSYDQMKKTQSYLMTGSAAGQDSTLTNSLTNGLN